MSMLEKHMLYLWDQPSSSARERIPREWNIRTVKVVVTVEEFPAIFSRDESDRVWRALKYMSCLLARGNTLRESKCALS